MKRKLLTKTKRLIIIGQHKSKCHNAEICQSRVYPFELYCWDCNKTIRYEDQVIFYPKYPKIRYIQHGTKKLMDKGYDFAYGCPGRKYFRDWITTCQFAISKRKRGYYAMAYAMGTAVRDCPDFIVAYKKRTS